MRVVFRVSGTRADYRDRSQQHLDVGWNIVIVTHVTQYFGKRRGSDHTGTRFWRKNIGVCTPPNKPLQLESKS